MKSKMVCFRSRASAEREEGEDGTEGGEDGWEVREAAKGLAIKEK